MTTTTLNTFGDTGIGYEFRDGAELMNAGKYRVTDPCYFLGHDDEFWSAFCNFMFGGNPGFRKDCYTIEIAGHKVLAWGTAYGDGCYDTTKNGSYVGHSGVDAGMLSLIPLELYELLADHLGTNDDTTAPTVELTSDFTPEMIEKGNCSYGPYETITGERERVNCERCGWDVESVNWNGLCDSCQREEEAEEEERRREEEEEEED